MKRFTLSWMALFGATVLFAGQGKTASSGNAETGKKLFVKNGCYECHGRAGQGGTFSAWTAPKLAPQPLPLPAFLAYVRHPAPGGMPTYTSKVISDADLTDIWAFLKSVPPSTPAKDIPLLNKE